jgi:thioredoxin-related protein
MATHSVERALLLTCAVFVAGVLDSPSARSEPPAESLITAPAKEKPNREPIYDVDADGTQLIAAAVKRAKRERKHVLIEWGGNWCGWCHKLHDVFKSDDLVSPIVVEQYVLVLVDCTANRELMEHYGGKDTRYAFPHLTILDVDGDVLTNQETGSLEIGPKHDPQAVAKFLETWQPEPADADALLAEALRQATDEDKRILLHVGTPSCGWCKILTAFLHEHETLLSADFIDLKIDTVRMPHGQEVAARFLPAKSGGVPWMVILDASGKTLSTSVGPEGNIGYPVRPAEIEHFLSMLAATKQRLQEKELQSLGADLDAYRLKRKERQSGDLNKRSAP